jgi:hypothetical protein
LGFDTGFSFDSQFGTNLGIGFSIGFGLGNSFCFGMSVYIIDIWKYIDCSLAWPACLVLVE